jgi:adenylate cyclase
VLRLTDEHGIAYAVALTALAFPGWTLATIGDTVNVASRLEGANKQYGTQIIIGGETLRFAGDRIEVRELDRLLVYGRQGELSIHELLALADGACNKSAWVACYERGLGAYQGSRIRRSAAIL